jgi:hypothetical protein
VITTFCGYFRGVHAEATVDARHVLVHLSGTPTSADERLRDYLETWIALTRSTAATRSEPPVRND